MARNFFEEEASEYSEESEISNDDEREIGAGKDKNQRYDDE